MATSKRPDSSIDQDRQPDRLWFSDPALMTLPGPAFHRQFLPASLDPSLLGDFKLTSEVTPLTAIVERAQLSSIPRSASLPNQHSSDRTVSKRGPLATYLSKTIKYNSILNKHLIWISNESHSGTCKVILGALS